MYSYMQYIVGFNIAIKVDSKTKISVLEGQFIPSIFIEYFRVGVITETNTQDYYIHKTCVRKFYGMYRCKRPLWVSYNQDIQH